MAVGVPANSDMLVSLNSKYRLVSGIEFTFLKEDERGRFYLMKNPENSKYLKLHESGKLAVELLDGSKTLGEIEAIIKESWEFDINELAVVLARNGFLENVEIKSKKEDFDPYSVRVVLLKPNSKLLQKTCWFIQHIYGKPFFLVTPILSLAIFTLFAYNLKDIFTDSFALFNYDTPVLPFLLGSIIFLIAEFLHEFAHMATAYRYGCKLGEAGLEFHIGIPFFYVKTSDIRSRGTAANIRVFEAGPLTTLMLGGLFTILYLFMPTWKYLWADLSFLLVLSSLVTLSPFIKTDGYFILQSILKFPNLFSHSIQYITITVRHWLGLVSHSDYEDYISRYSSSEKHILKIYSWISLAGMISLVSVFVVMFMQMRVIQVLLLTSDILSGRNQTYTLKMYVLWIFYMSSFLLSLVGASILLIKNLRRRLLHQSITLPSSIKSEVAPRKS
jgi:hypothetical protein